MKKYIVLLVTVCCFLTCSAGGLYGTFTDESGLSNLTFHSDGTLVVSTMDVSVDMKFSVKKNKVEVIEPNGAITELEYDGKDTLSGFNGLKYTRKK